ncbi:MAG: zf-HC2 domain-containing protein [Candidatus Riflebacteria bacterium]|nr:zf-HC2 domain-containing protein [Candidatus Riflebacteria bacterium]
MNCNECQEYMVAHLEGALEQETDLAWKKHLSECDDCKEILQSFQELEFELKKRGPITADVSLVNPVMDRIKRIEVNKQSQETERSTFMSRLLKWRWSMGVGAFAGMALLILLVVFPGTNNIAAAAEAISRGVKAIGKLTSIHLKGKLRTLPRDNFSSIAPDQEFVDIELWKEFKPAVKWKVEKPGRIAAMNGETTILFIRPDYAYKIPEPTRSAFDTGWLLQIADISGSLNEELKTIEKNGLKTKVEHIKDASGNPKTEVTVEVKSAYSGDDFLKNTFFCTADTRRVYVFDDQSGLLTAARIYLEGWTDSTLLFELSQIDYDPEFASETFQIDLPEDVTWDRSGDILPDNKKYEAMSSEEAARTFFEACGREDWEEAGKFDTITTSFKTYYGGIKIISLGEHFTGMISLINGDEFVPYEIELRDGTKRKHNIALRRHQTTNRWFVDGGI